MKFEPHTEISELTNLTISKQFIPSYVSSYFNNLFPNQNLFIIVDSKHLLQNFFSQIPKFSKRNKTGLLGTDKFPLRFTEHLGLSRLE
jgi:hypothetical protein